MPFMRRRPLLRTAVVGGGAYMAGKAAGRQAGQQYVPDQRPSGPDEQAVGPDEQAAAAPAAAEPTLADQMNDLADLHNRGALSDDEFAAAKAKLLGG
jgi:hypothetical protein